MLSGVKAACIPQCGCGVIAVGRPHGMQRTACTGRSWLDTTNILYQPWVVGFLSYLTCSETEFVLINNRHRHGGLESTSSTASAVYSQLFTKTTSSQAQGSYSGSSASSWAACSECSSCRRCRGCRGCRAVAQ